VRVALDTNTYRRFVEGDPIAVDVVRRADTIALPVPVIAELRFGFANGTRGRQNEARLVTFTDSPRVVVLSCDEQTTHFYASLKLQLKRQGTPIPINDVWIAALVIQHDLSLYTLDADFDRIPQLARI
jgi:predicted nucleic acid-binding protein